MHASAPKNTEPTPADLRTIVLFNAAYLIVAIIAAFVRDSEEFLRREARGSDTSTMPESALVKTCDFARIAEGATGSAPPSCRSVWLMRPTCQSCRKMRPPAS